MNLIFDEQIMLVCPSWNYTHDRSISQDEPPRDNEPNITNINNLKKKQALCHGRCSLQSFLHKSARKI